MPADLAAMEKRWLALMAAARPPAAGAMATFAELVAAYTAPERHYHNLDHIAALLALCDAERSEFADPATVQLAILFHDAVYDARRPKGNEHESARLARDRLRALAFEEARCQKVAAFIEATVHDGTAPPDEPDLRRFLDLDLSILAAPPAEYDAYAAAIRREYGFVADEPYRAGRSRVLASFLDRDQLFHCDDHRSRWDAQARVNLRRELARLNPGAVA